STDPAFEPVTGTIAAEQGGTIAAADNRIRIIVPAGALPSVTRFTVAPVSGDAQPDAMPHVRVGDLIFTVLAETLTGEAITEFSRPLQFVMQLTEEDLAAEIDPADVFMFYYDPDLSRWIAVPTVYDASLLTL